VVRVSTEDVEWIFCGSDKRRRPVKSASARGISEKRRKLECDNVSGQDTGWQKRSDIPPSFTPSGNRVTIPHETPCKPPNRADQEGGRDKDACADDDGFDEYPQKEDVGI
jgi:hypothetical protein